MKLINKENNKNDAAIEITHDIIRVYYGLSL
jgi:hypothetical protein